MSAGPASVRVGIVGSGYIAAAHSAAYKHVAGTYPDVARSVVLAAAGVAAERLHGEVIE